MEECDVKVWSELKKLGKGISGKLLLTRGRIFGSDKSKTFLDEMSK